MKENFVSSKNIIDKRASVLVELQATKDKVILRHIWTFCFLSSPQLQSSLLSTVWWMWMEWKWMLYSQEWWMTILFWEIFSSLHFFVFVFFIFCSFCMMNDEWRWNGMIPYIISFDSSSTKPTLHERKVLCPSYSTSITLIQHTSLDWCYTKSWKEW